MIPLKSSCEPHPTVLAAPLRTSTDAVALFRRCCLADLLAVSWSRGGAAAPEYREELIFPLNPQHNHAPGIVECPNGDLLVSWYRGSGERSADDVAVLGARLTKGASTWSEPFVMADNPGFPDCNTCMMIDKHRSCGCSGRSSWPTTGNRR